MGYLVPKTKKQQEYAFNTELAGAFTSQEVLDTMKKLVDAYNETDPAAFKKNADSHFHSLYNVIHEMGIDQNQLVADDEYYFPKEQRTQENFKAVFHKLWKSISMADNFKKSEDPSMRSKANVAEIYHNYIPAYDEILKQKEMHNGLDRYCGYKVRDARPDALRNLILIENEHKNGEPFSKKDMIDIHTETDILNRSFSLYDGLKMVDEGFFIGNSIKTPADLKEYIAKYETMLRDQLEQDGKDFYIFAQGYAKAGYHGESVRRLDEDDLKAVYSKIEAMEQEKQLNQEKDELNHLDDDLKPFVQELNDLQDVGKVNEYGRAIISNYNYAVKQASDQNIDKDEDIEAAQKAYYSELMDAKVERERINQCLTGTIKKRLPYNVEYKRDDRTEAGKLDEKFEASIDACEDIVSPYTASAKEFSGQLEEERKASKEKTVAAKKEFKEVLEQQLRTDLPQYNKEIQPKLKEIEEKRQSLLENLYDPEYEKKKKALKDEIRTLKESLNSHISGYKEMRSQNQRKLEESLKQFQDEMNGSYQKEKNKKLDCLKTAVDSLKNAQKEMQKDYNNTKQGQRIAKAAEKNKAAQDKIQDIRNKEQENARQKLCGQLKDICEAMNSVKKTSIFGNSAQYDAMVQAIKDYREQKIDANAAHKACQNYLQLSLNNNGGLDKMNSKAGKIRKQSCVRMLELLEKAPDFKKSKQAENGIAPDGLEGAHKEKIDYETLKASLARKSAEVTVNVGEKDAKAYSNLNAKMSEIKKAKEEAAKQNRKNENIKNTDNKKGPEAPVMGK